jgi:superfamily II helicase
LWDMKNSRTKVRSVVLSTKRLMTSKFGCRAWPRDIVNFRENRSNRIQSLCSIAPILRKKSFRKSIQKARWQSETVLWDERNASAVTIA